MKHQAIRFEQTSAGSYDVLLDGKRIGHVGKVGRLWAGRLNSGEAITGFPTRAAVVAELQRRSK